MPEQIVASVTTPVFSRKFFDFSEPKISFLEDNDSSFVDFFLSSESEEREKLPKTTEEEKKL